MDALRAMLSTWRVRVGLGLALALGFGLWSNTLTDHVGFGSSLVAAVYASVMGALAGAGLPLALRKRKVDVPASHAALVAALTPVAYVVLVALAVLAHGLLAPACGPAHGAVYYVLVALPGAILAGLVGLSLGALTSRRGRGTGLAIAIVPLFIVWTLARFYATPTIFAYDPFFGFYPGALYDERIPLGLPLVTYRIGTLGWIIALASFVTLAWSPGATFSRDALRARIPALVTALAGIALGLGIYLAGPALGHRHDAGDIARKLGGETWSRRCVVRYDRSIDARQARATARDCDTRIAQLEQFYGVHVSRRVTVFLFASADQKQSLMGAADTYIAKPWRYEVYLQYAPFPHPVLKHELAHVVAAEMAPGPLHITAQASFIPVPGLIEGAAVAGAWEGESDVTPHQWSRTMLEAGLAPRVRTLTGLGFFATGSLTAYTAAGSFCRWLHDTRGSERFRKLYATGDFEASYGTDVGALEREWHTFLRTVAVPERTLARARTRFRRASIFGRQCPFELEALATDAHRHLAAGEVRRAEEEYATLVSRDPTDARTRMQLAVARVRAGDVPGALRVADEAERVLGVAAGNRVRMATADATWRWRSGDEALAIYQRLDEALFEEDEARTLAIKLRVLREGGERAEGLRDLLIGRGELDASPTVAAVRLSALHARTRDPMASYLVGRQLFAYERFDDMLATVELDGVASLGDARVLGEARRMVATARYRAGDLDGARAMFEMIAADETRPMGVRETARDWVDRIEREGAR